MCFSVFIIKTFVSLLIDSRKPFYLCLLKSVFCIIPLIPTMSYCVSHGKDKVMFLSEEELKKPSSVILPEDDEPHGLLLPNGEINWNCPCLGNMVVGPCSVEFRESISCFHKSTADPKGSDCLEQFKEMNDCMSKYPALYKKSEEEEESQLHSIKEQEDEATNLSKVTGDSNNTIATESN